MDECACQEAPWTPSFAQQTFTGPLFCFLLWGFPFFGLPPAPTPACSGVSAVWREVTCERRGIFLGGPGLQTSVSTVFACVSRVGYLRFLLSPLPFPARPGSWLVAAGHGGRWCPVGPLSPWPLSPARGEPWPSGAQLSFPGLAACAQVQLSAEGRAAPALLPCPVVIKSILSGHACVCPQRLGDPC